MKWTIENVVGLLSAVIDNIPIFRKTVAVSIAYLAASVVATVVAVQRDLPAAILDQTSGKTATDTLTGNGTALAAPPYMLAILVQYPRYLRASRRHLPSAREGIAVAIKTPRFRMYSSGAQSTQRRLQL